MNRRKFIHFSITGVLSTPFLLLNAEENDLFKTTEEKKIEDIIQNYYGEKKRVEYSKDIEIIVPRIASNSGAVPCRIRTQLEAKKIMIFIPKNDEALVGTFIVPKDELIDYNVKMKITKAGSISEAFAVVEKEDGILYYANKKFEVALAGGCEE